MRPSLHKALPFPASDASLLAILNALPQAVCVLADDGAIRFMNAQAELMFGIKASKLADLLLPDTNLDGWIHAAIASESVTKRYDYSLQLSSGACIQANLQIAPLHPAPDMPPDACLLLIDPIQGLETYRRSIAQQEANRSSAVMAAMLAHEIKNPLSGIKGAAQLIEQQASEEDKPLLELICREVGRINELMQKIEFFSNAPVDCSQSINIHEVLADVSALARQSFAASVNIKTDYDPSLPEVAGDKALLVQLFVNLLQNAAEVLAGRSDGEIIIKTSYQGQQRIRSAGDDRIIRLPVCIEIEDNGGGIPESIRPLLFEPFVTSKPGGKGLGLAIVSKIVGDHQGSISLADALEGRTKFRVLLPAKG